LNKQIINYNKQSGKKGTPLRRMGVQPVVIGGSDSAELDKFQWQRDRALHQIQCHALEPRKPKARSASNRNRPAVLHMQHAVA
jgi:hypothetical protein